MKDESDALLPDLELQEVLGRLECDEMTENLFCGHFVPKPWGKGVCLITDYTPLLLAFVLMILKLAGQKGDDDCRLKLPLRLA